MASAKFPDYADRNRRLRTFDRFPHPSIGGLKHAVLADAGLFFTGTGDETTCFYCGGKLLCWETNDDPYNEHAKWYPNCDFIQGKLHERSLENRSPPEDSDDKRSIVEGSAEEVDQERSVAPDDNGLSGGRSTQDITYIIPYSKPTFPGYADISKRRESFKTYPGNAEGQKENMAKAGFFYMGHGDNVRCFHCGEVHSNWDDDDDPAVEHVRWHPDCWFLRLLLGNEFSHVRKVHKEHIAQQLAEERRSTDAPTEERVRELMSLYSDNPVLPATVTVDIVELAIRHRLNAKGEINVPDENDLATAVECVTRLPRTIRSGETSWYRSLYPHSDVSAPDHHEAARGLQTVAEDSTVNAQRPPSRIQDVCGSDDNGAIQPEALAHRKNLYTVPHSRPAFPHYATLASRERSFLTYPIDAKGNTEKMAKSGFFYTGYAERTTCFQCGNSLCSWVDEDEPLVEHAMWFPDCSYVELMRCKETISSLRETHRSIIAERQAIEHSLSDNLPEPLLRDLMSTPLVHRLLQQSIDRGIMELAIRKRLNATGLIDVLDEADLRGALADVVSLPENVRTRELSKTEPGSLSKCVICRTGYRNCIFLPCSHLVACTDCAAVSAACPTCKRQVVTRRNVFLA